MGHDSLWRCRQAGRQDKLVNQSLSPPAVGGWVGGWVGGRRRSLHSIFSFFGVCAPLHARTHAPVQVHAQERAQGAIAASCRGDEDVDGLAVCEEGLHRCGVGDIALLQRDVLGQRHA